MHEAISLSGELVGATKLAGNPSAFEARQETSAGDGTGGLHRSRKLIHAPHPVEDHKLIPSRLKLR